MSSNCSSATFLVLLPWTTSLLLSESVLLMQNGEQQCLSVRDVVRNKSVSICYVNRFKLAHKQSINVSCNDKHPIWYCLVHTLMPPLCQTGQGATQMLQQRLLFALPHSEKDGQGEFSSHQSSSEHDGWRITLMALGKPSYE